VEFAELRDGLTKRCAPCEHEDVDGIEVPPAAEAASEVRARVGGGVELLAEGAKEAEIALGELGGDPEHPGDDEIDGDLVSEPAEL
jgi:hypothetical protein